MKRYDPGLEGPCPELERAVMEECPEGEYVKAEEVNESLKALVEERDRLLKALREIADYDKHSPHGRGSGICPYGCDTPWIAKTALGIECDVPSEVGDFR